MCIKGSAKKAHGENSNEKFVYIMPVRIVKEIINEMVEAARVYRNRNYPKAARNVALIYLLESGYKYRLLDRCCSGHLRRIISEAEDLNEGFKNHCYTKFKKLNKST